jgi:hypothetical protein
MRSASSASVSPCGQRQQVVEVHAADAAPAQVLGHQRRLDAVDQALELGQVLASASASAEPSDSPTPCRLIGIRGARALEGVHRGAAVEEEVLAVDFEEASAGPSLEDLAVVRLAKADPGAVRVWFAAS